MTESARGFVLSFFGRVSKCVSYRGPNLEKGKRKGNFKKTRKRAAINPFFVSPISVSPSFFLWSEILNLCRVIEFRLYDRKQGRKRAGQRGDFSG